MLNQNKIVFAIDPSTKCTGIAVFKDEVLIDVDAITVPRAFTGKIAIAYMCPKIINKFRDYLEMFEDVTVVMEDQEWRGKEERMKPMAFGILYGLVCSIYASLFHINNEKEIYLYLPREWKGTTPKKIMCTRVFNKEPDKTLILGANDDILDAVGLGRHYYEKCKKKKN